MRRLWISVFLAAEGALYLAFLTLDLLNRSSQTLWLKYAGILLCLVVALLCALRGGNRLIAPALALTAGADWFLLFGHNPLIAGVVLFLGVQLLYLLRLHRAGAGTAPLLRIISAAVLLTAALVLRMATPLNLLALLYFSQLLSNTILAWRRSNLRRFALGLTLFVGCDICVGLFNIFPTLPFVSVGMWLFYLPSQVLIALSALPPKEVYDETK